MKGKSPYKQPVALLRRLALVSRLGSHISIDRKRYIVTMEEPPLVFDCVPITHDNIMSTVELTVLSVMKDVSGNFVPNPTKAEVRQDLILGLKRLKASL